MSLKGWIKMHRKITEWELYKDIAAKTLFLHLLLTASYKDTVSPSGFVIHAGYCFTSIRRLAEETGLSVQQVRTALKKLEATHALTQQVTQVATQRMTLIKLEKWAFYQADTDLSTQVLTHLSTQGSTHYINNNNNKYNNNTKNKSEKNIVSIYDFEKIEAMELEKLKKENEK